MVLTKTVINATTMLRVAICAATLLCALSAPARSTVTLRKAVAIDSVKVDPEKPHGAVTFSVTGNQPWKVTLDDSIMVSVEVCYDEEPRKRESIPIEYRLYRLNPKDGIYRQIARQTYRIQKTVGRLLVRIDSDRYRLYGLNGTELFAEQLGETPATSNVTTIKVYADKAGLPLAKTVRFYPETQSNSDTVDIPDGLDLSSSPFGYWTYLDRVTPADRHVELGGKYTLAALADPQKPGVIILAYVAGMDHDQPRWNAGDVKGYLYPTAFPGHYDVEWYDANHRKLELGENSATFEGTDMLVVEFPLYATQIRFSKTDANAR